MRRSRNNFFDILFSKVAFNHNHSHWNSSKLGWYPAGKLDCILCFIYLSCVLHICIVFCISVLCFVCLCCVLYVCVVFCTCGPPYKTALMNKQSKAKTAKSEHLTLTLKGPQKAYVLKLPVYLPWSSNCKGNISIYT